MQYHTLLLTLEYTTNKACHSRSTKRDPSLLGVLRNREVALFMGHTTSMPMLYRNIQITVHVLCHNINVGLKVETRVTTFMD